MITTIMMLLLTMEGRMRMSEAAMVIATTKEKVVLVALWSMTTMMQPP
jgi:hypothetical protein